MEPTQSPVKLNISYTIVTTVISVTNEWETVSGKKVGEETILEKVNRGWFVLFVGSYEKLFFGYEKPEFAKGDMVKITFTKQEPVDASPL